MREEEEERECKRKVIDAKAFQRFGKATIGCVQSEGKGRKTLPTTTRWSCGVISLSKIDDVIADFQAASPHRIGRSAGACGLRFYYFAEQAPFADGCVNLSPHAEVGLT